MAAALVTITNSSRQIVPILVSTIAESVANASSGIDATTNCQLSIAPGAQITLESQRTDRGQLEQLRRLGLINLSN